MCIVLIMPQGANQQMEKTLVRFFGGAAMVCGAWLGLPTIAHGQSPSLNIYADTVPGPARRAVGPQVIHVHNNGAPATGVSVTFTPPKNAKVDTTCQEDHLPGGYRSYTCLVGSLGSGETADVTFSISMIKSGVADVGVDVTYDQGGSAGALISITIF
jgi:hypothetical protein